MRSSETRTPDTNALLLAGVLEDSTDEADEVSWVVIGVHDEFEFGLPFGNEGATNRHHYVLAGRDGGEVALDDVLPDSLAFGINKRDVVLLTGDARSDGVNVGLVAGDLVVDCGGDHCIVEATPREGHLLGPGVVVDVIGRELGHFLRGEKFLFPCTFSSGLPSRVHTAAGMLEKSGRKADDVATKPNKLQSAPVGDDLHGVGHIPEAGGLDCIDHLAFVILDRGVPFETVARVRKLSGLALGWSVGLGPGGLGCGLGCRFSHNVSPLQRIVTG